MSESNTNPPTELEGAPVDPELVVDAPNQLDELLKSDPETAAEFIDAFEHPNRQADLYPKIVKVEDESTDEAGGEGDDAGVAGDDGGSTTTPPAETTGEPAPPPVTTPDDGAHEVVEDLDDSQYTIGEWSFPREHLDGLRGLYEWRTGLPQEAAVAIDQLLSGQYYLVPKTASPGGNGQGPVQGSEGGSPAASTTGVVGDPAASTTTPPFNPDDYLDPKAAEDIHALRAQLAHLEQSNAEAARRQAEDNQRRQEATYKAAVDQSIAEVRDRYGLDDTEWAKLEARTIQRQIIPALVQTAADPKSGFTQAFETVYLSDPEFRARELARLQANDQAERAALTERKRKASSVGASSTPVPRQSTVRVPKSEQDKLDMMTAEVAALLNGNT